MDITTVIAAAAIAAGVPIDLYQAICWVESKHTNVISHVDGKSPSYGPAQLKMATARMVRRKVHASEMFDVSKTTYMGALYLRRQLTRYGSWECAATGYNRGSIKRAHFDNSRNSCQNEYVTRVRIALKDKPWTGQERFKTVSKLPSLYSTSAIIPN